MRRYVTKHARQRMKERCGLNKGSMERVAGIVYEKGLKREDTYGKLRRYMDRLSVYNGISDQSRIYGDKVFVFHNERLITVIQLCPKLKKTADLVRKKRKIPFHNCLED